MNATTCVLIVAGFMAGTVPAEPKRQDCDCQSFAPSTVRCHQSAWRRFASADPRNEEQLNELLDAMTEGVESGQRASDYGCPDDPSETCAEACTPVLWDSFYDLASKTTVAHDRWGALALVFGTYMDTGAPQGVVPRLEAIALTFLEQPRDRVTTETVLRMMSFYDLRSRRIESALLKLMQSDTGLVRALAFRRFAEFTKCELPFAADADDEKRRKQIEEVRRWWLSTGA